MSASVRNRKLDDLGAGEPVQLLQAFPRVAERRAEGVPLEHMASPCRGIGGVDQTIDRLEDKGLLNNSCRASDDCTPRHTLTLPTRAIRRLGIEWVAAVKCKSANGKYAASGSPRTVVFPTLDTLTASPEVSDGVARTAPSVTPQTYRTHVAVTAVEMFARFFGEQLRPVATGDGSDGKRISHAPQHIRGGQQDHA